LLGVIFKKDTCGQFARSDLLTVLNAGGEIIHQQTGLNQDGGETVKRLIGAADTASNPVHTHE
jgi:hypothetical protein